MPTPCRTEGAAAEAPADPRPAPPSASGSPGAPSAAGADGSGGPSDHELVLRARAGDEGSFEALYRRHEARAWRVARNLVGNREDAGDVVQEAFLRVFKSLDRFDFEHEFTTWLYRIVTNLAIDHLRRRRPALSTSGASDEERDLELPDDSARRPDDDLARAETARAVRACIDSLAPHFQSVLVLRELEGLPCTEIAEIVGATHVTVRWRLHRGRKLFQDEWERRARLSESGGARALSEYAESANDAASPDVPPPTTTTDFE